MQNDTKNTHISAVVYLRTIHTVRSLPYSIHTVCCCPRVSMCVSDMCMTTAIIILGRWSDLTPTNYVWPASQDRVPSVWCCPTPHWLVNEGLCGGVRAGWWRRGWTAEGWGGPCSAASFVSLYRASCWFTAPLRPQQTEATQGLAAEPSGQCGTLAGFAGPPKRSPSYQFLNCRYGNRAVSIRLGVRSVWLHSSFSLHLYLLPRWLSLQHPHPPVFHPPPFTCFSGTDQQLSQPHSEQVHWPQNKTLFSAICLDCSFKM